MHAEVVLGSARVQDHLERRRIAERRAEQQGIGKVREKDNKFDI